MLDRSIDPGPPEAEIKWWHAPAYFGGLFGVAVLVWLALYGAARLVMAYALVGAYTLGSLAAVLGCVVLMRRKSVRARWTGIALFGVLMLVILSAVGR